MIKGCCVAAGLTLMASSAVLADPPPVATYAALPAAQDLRLSPDGTMIAMIAPYKDHPAFVVRSLEGAKISVLPTEDTLPNWIEWKTPNRLLVSVRFTSFTRGYGTAASEETRLFFSDADGSHLVQLKVTKAMPTSVGAEVLGDVGNRIPQFQDRVVSLLPDDPEHILLAVTPLNDWLHPEVQRVDVNTGRTRLVHGEMAEVTDWAADAEGDVRGAERIDQIGMLGRRTHRVILARSSADGDWRTVKEGEYNKGDRFDLVGFSKEDRNILYVLADDEHGLLAGRTYDLSTGSLGPVLASGAACGEDVSALLRDYQLIGFHTPCNGSTTILLDSAWQHDWDLVSKALKTNFVKLVDRTADGQRALFSVEQTASSPTTYWLIDRRSGKTDLRWIGEAYRNLPDEQVASMRQVTYKARDGLDIPAFVTLPVGHRDGPIPFIVLPHGGPTANDAFRFDWMAQFFASRGYGVLQPQFRGSTGYGNAFQEAGLQEWGGAMQDDVTDGTRWLVDQKLADPGRICIVGASYGGYAALMGVVKEPGLYACAAAFAPVTDLDLLIHNMREFAFSDINIPRLKNGAQSADALSPAQNADKIRVPVLLMHGRNDFTVQIEHSEEMEHALRRAGKQVEAIYLDGADHYFSRSSDRLAWLTAVDKLLASTIGGAGKVSSTAVQVQQ